MVDVLSATSIRHRAALAALLAAWFAPAAASAEPFEDLTSAAGLALDAAAMSHNSLIAAVSYGDVTGDGQPDLVVSGGNRAPAFFARTGALTWSGPTLLPGPPDAAAFGHTLFDMDGDGDLDLYIARNGPDTLLENLGDGTFSDASGARLTGRHTWSSTAAAGDLDGDGDLDLVVTSYIDRVSFPSHRCATNVVLENDGRGFFSDVSEAWGFLDGPAGCSFIPALLDVDEDGQLDVLIVNDFAQFSGGQELWINAGPGSTGAWSFANRASQLGVVAPQYGMGPAIAPADADGALDLVITNIGGAILLHRGADGGFVDATEARHPGPTFARDGYQVSWTAALVDVDNDGWLDLVLASGALIAADFIANPSAQESTWFRGTPSGRFVEPIPAPHLASGGVARDLVLADVDLDGRVDALIAHLDGRLTFLHNTAPSPPAARLVLHPRYTGANAAGAWITATCGGAVRRRVVTAGGAFGDAATAASVQLAFPPPCDTPGQPLSVNLTWPSGFSEAFDLPTGTSVARTEPPWLTATAEAVVIDLASGDGGFATTPTATADHAVVGPFIEGPAGVFTAAVDADPDATELRFDLRVGTEPLGAHPRVLRTLAPAAALRTTPTPPVEGRPFAIHARPRDATGAAVGPEHAVAVDVDGVVYPLAPAPTGFMATAPPPPPERTTLALEVDGAAFGAALQVPTAPPADPDRSTLEWRDLYVRSDAVSHAAITLRAELRDANGAPFVPAEDRVRLATDAGGELAPATYTSNTTTLRLDFAHASLPDGALVWLAVDGAPIGEARRVAHLDALADAAAFVTPSRSTCAFSERALRADGQDVGTALLTLRDAYGTTVPEADLSVTWHATGVTVRDVAATSFASYRVTAIAGWSPGAGTVTLDVGGAPGVVVCRVDLVDRALPAPSSATSTIVAAAGEPLAVGVPAVLRVLPRTSAERAVGSGLDLAVAASQGTLEAEARYVGLGRYEIELTPATPGTVTVTVSHDEPPLYVVGSWLVAGPGGEDAAAADVVEPDAAPVDSAAETVDDGDAAAPPPDADAAPLDGDGDDVDAEPGPGDAEPGPQDGADGGALDAEVAADADAEGPLDVDATADTSDEDAPGILDVDTTPAPADTSVIAAPEVNEADGDAITATETALDAGLDRADADRLRQDGGCGANPPGAQGAWWGLALALAILWRRPRQSRASCTPRSRGSRSTRSEGARRWPWLRRRRPSAASPRPRTDRP
ncbi:MAG: hypothetical protein CVU56_08635 [Deltaproteobacteria bacterium HGW-Deltaproteobacteria-14]|nr:MAG: hypothetical protein CVU56_08635 [Deltaproteobacteria bacterium HGW-Deltaproteobacteria-14]